MPLSIRIVPRPRFTVSFAYELASSTSNSWTPTADELQYLIDHLRAQAQLNENYAREERCLAAVIDATSAYQDLTSLPFPPENISQLPFLHPLSFFSHKSRRHTSSPPLQPYRALTSNTSHPAPFQ